MIVIREWEKEAPYTSMQWNATHASKLPEWGRAWTRGAGTQPASQTHHIMCCSVMSVWPRSSSIPPPHALHATLKTLSDFSLVKASFSCSGAEAPSPSSPPRSSSEGCCWTNERADRRFVDKEWMARMMMEDQMSCRIRRRQVIKFLWT